MYFNDIFRATWPSASNIHCLLNAWEETISVQYYKKLYKKVKWPRYRPGVAQRVGRGIALLFHYRGTRRRWSVSSTPRPHFTPGKTRYPFYRRLGGPQGRSGRAENLVPTGIRCRTVQPVAQSLYRLSYPAQIKSYRDIIFYISNITV